ncbi:COP9 signalosome complex subunit [Musa troglodytarum]|uniref:COP9 signalosome complex subunit n=1 Tax=Musa troglodytarum TaxID=320322 RepID=A0A9E7FT09_9LILI|nr:COP9 signalosome complex subunit [Musa troglodytarum]
MASSSSGSGLTFKLHPLVIVNISDHHTRVRAQIQHSASASAAPLAEGVGGRVFGCVIGVQRGRTVEIFNSFELLYDPLTHSLDRSFLEKKQELYKKVFPNFYILGWYSTGSEAQESDLQIHKATTAAKAADNGSSSGGSSRGHSLVKEEPAVLSLDSGRNCTQSDSERKLWVFARSFDSSVDDRGRLGLLHLWRRQRQKASAMEAEAALGLAREAERISVDHVAHLKPSDGGSAATQCDIPLDNSFLRQVSSLLRRLPAMESEKFQDDFLMEYNDTLLVAYLAMLTNCSSTCSGAHGYDPTRESPSSAPGLHGIFSGLGRTMLDLRLGGSQDMT